MPAAIRSINRQTYIKLVKAAAARAQLNFDETNKLVKFAETADAVGVGSFEGRGDSPACTWTLAGVPDPNDLDSYRRLDFAIILDDFMDSATTLVDGRKNDPFPTVKITDEL